MIELTTEDRVYVASTNSWLKRTESGLVPTSPPEHILGVIDDETELYNTAGLLMNLGKIAALCAREDLAFSIVSLYFGKIPIQEASRFLQGFARESDVVGRSELNVFTILAPATGKQGAARLVQRIKVEYPMVHAGVRSIERFLANPVSPEEMLMAANEIVRGEMIYEKVGS